MSRRLLVTGGAGFIGATMVHHCLTAHPEDRAVVLDALTYAGSPHNLDGLPGDRLRLMVGDVCDAALVADLIRSEALDTIVHCAAETHVDRSIQASSAFVRSNVLGTQAVLDAARQVWMQERAVDKPVRFLHVSTDEVFGALNPEDPPFTETSAYAPNSPYAASKAGSDHLVRASHHTHGLPTLIATCSNGYGPRQHPEKLIPRMITQALCGQPLPVYGDGMQVRQWMHVADQVTALDLILTHAEPGSTVCVGGGEEQTNLGVVRTLCRLLDEAFAADLSLAARYPEAPPAQGRSCDSLIRFVTDRPGHDRRYALNGSRLARLGFVPARRFEAGLDATVAWYLEREPWWRDALTRSERLT